MVGYTSALSDEYFVVSNTLPRPAERINSKLTEGWVRQNRDGKGFRGLYEASAGVNDTISASRLPSNPFSTFSLLSTITPS
jgi:hypothetical protein